MKEGCWFAALITPLANSFHQLHFSSLPNGKKSWELIEKKGSAAGSEIWKLKIFNGAAAEERTMKFISSFLLWWVMGAAAPMAPPRRENKEEMNEWVSDDQQQESAAERRQEWKEINEINWLELCRNLSLQAAPTKQNQSFHSLQLWLKCWLLLR